MDAHPQEDGNASVMSSIEMLMNPKKRGGDSDSGSGSGSGAESDRGSVAASDVSHTKLLANMPVPDDVTVGRRAVHTPVRAVRSSHRPSQPQPRGGGGGGGGSRRVSVSVSEAGDDGTEGGDDESYEDDDSRDGSRDGSVASRRGGRAASERSKSPSEVANDKRHILYQFDRLERNGMRMPRRFTMDDSLRDMQAELDRVKLDREVDVSVKFQREMLMTCITGIELLNNKFDPLNVKLDGWSDSISERLSDYDEVFEELHLKHRGKVQLAPELKLLMMVGGSGVMFHLTSSMFRQSSMPDLEQVMRKNPALMRQFAQATMGEMQQQQQAKQQPQRQQQGGGGGGGGGGIFSMLGGLFGGGGGGGGGGSGSAYVQQQQQQSSASPQGSVMRGPMPMDDVLRQLHVGAFPGGSPLHPGTPSGGNGMGVQQPQRHIDVLSEAGDLGDLADELMGAAPPAAAAGRAKPRAPAKPRGGRGGAGA
jgi:hypothetical protein